MEYLKLFCEKTGIADEDYKFIESKYNEMYEKGGKDEFEKLVVRMKANDKVSYDIIVVILEDTKKFAEKIGIHEYTMYLMLLISSSQFLLDIYKERKVDVNIFWDTMCDIKYKIDECKTVYNVIGTFVPSWYRAFFDIQIVKLGRLEYQVYKSRYDYNNKGVDIKVDDPVINIHIPSCGPLTKEEVIESLKKAYKFFNFDGKLATFVCESWLLGKQIETICKEGSNMRAFYNMYEVVEAEDDVGFYDCWRVFGVIYDNNPDKLPQNTTLQKNIVNYLKEGNTIQTATGFLIFDGSKVL